MLNCVKVNVFPSASVSAPVKISPDLALPCGVVSVSSLATGVSLTGVILKLSVAVLVADPSLRVYVTTGTVPL